jgi:glycosyltransferase involved in cell wall biosynthesis
MPCANTSTSVVAKSGSPRWSVLSSGCRSAIWSIYGRRVRAAPSADACRRERLAEDDFHFTPTPMHRMGGAQLTPHLLYIGGEDHHLRIPAMLALSNNGFRVTAAGSGDPAPFVQAGLDFRPFHFDRFINPPGDWRALKVLSALLTKLRPDLAQSFDNKPNLMLPLAARSVPDVRVVRTINGRAWLYSSRSPLVLTLRPIYRALHRFAARSTAATTFEIRDDQAFFERHRLLGGKGNELIPGAGIDIEGFERALAMGPSPAQLRQELGLETAEVVITVTRMTRQKGIPALLKAAALVHEARPGVCFLLVGPRQSEGPLAVAQAEIDRHVPYVRALGPRSDVAALLGLADGLRSPPNIAKAYHVYSSRRHSPVSRS